MDYLYARASLQLKNVCKIQATRKSEHVHGNQLSQYFCGKFDIWNVNCMWKRYSFSTDERMFFWKYRNFRDTRCIDPRETRTPNLRIHAECFIHLSYQGQTFAVTYSRILALAVWLLLMQQHSFPTRERIFLWNNINMMRHLTSYPQFVKCQIHTLLFLQSLCGYQWCIIIFVVVV